MPANIYGREREWQKLLSWIRDRNSKNSKNSKNILLLEGSPGTGKTFLAKAALEQCGFLVAEINPGNVTHERVTTCLRQLTECSLEESPRRVAILFDDVDGYPTRNDGRQKDDQRGRNEQEERSEARSGKGREEGQEEEEKTKRTAIGALLAYVEQQQKNKKKRRDAGTGPILCTANTYVKTIHQVAEVVRFYPLPIDVCFALCRSLMPSGNETVIKRIVHASKGDARQICNNVRFEAITETSNVQKNDNSADRALDAFESARALLQGKKKRVDFTYDCGIFAQSIFWHNAPRFAKDETVQDLAKLSDDFSILDTWNVRFWNEDDGLRENLFQLTATHVASWKIECKSSLEVPTFVNSSKMRSLDETTVLEKLIEKMDPEKRAEHNRKKRASCERRKKSCSSCTSCDGKNVGHFLGHCDCASDD
jgi:SpoVK/Ycf46/Vps4 family AAA+-type ATPase